MNRTEQPFLLHLHYYTYKDKEIKQIIKETERQRDRETGRERYTERERPREREREREGDRERERERERESKREREIIFHVCFQRSQW